MKTNNKPVTARIAITGRHSSFELPITNIGSSGVTCRTGPNDSPAEEWFPFNSPAGAQTTLLDKEGRVVAP